MSTFCFYFNESRCRSCSCLGEPQENQLRRKEELIQYSLSGFSPFALENSVQSPPQGFRNRAKMVVTGTVDNPVIGLTGDEKLDSGREILSCPIHHPRLNALIAALPRAIARYHLTPYQIENRRGELKGLIAFYSPASDELYLRFVLRSRECIPLIQKLIPELQAAFPSLRCVSINIQPVPHAILEGREEIILTEQKFIHHQLGDLRLKLAPRAFVQTNAVVALALYETAAKWIAEAQPTRMLELFCGQGAFSFFAQKSASHILGIELNDQAVQTANETARELGLLHLEFKTADAANVGTEAAAFGPNLILANPPRRGLGDSLQIIKTLQPDNFIYSSCWVKSLATDLTSLVQDYRIRKCRIFDMFPHTEHFETLVWLERR